MTNPHLELLEKTVEAAKEKYSTAELGQKMLDELFARNPEAKTFFEGIVVEDFTSRKFNLVFEYMVDAIVSPEYARFNMISELYRHRYNNIYDEEYYYVLIACFCSVVKAAAGKIASQQELECWNEIEQVASFPVQQAARELETL